MKHLLKFAAGSGVGGNRPQARVCVREMRPLKTVRAREVAYGTVLKILGETVLKNIKLMTTPSHGCHQVLCSNRRMRGLLQDVSGDLASKAGRSNGVLS